MEQVPYLFYSHNTLYHARHLLLYKRWGYIFNSIISYFSPFVNSFIINNFIFYFQLFMVATQQSQIKSRTRSQLSLLGITCPNLKVLLSCAFTPLSGNCSFFSNSFNRIFTKCSFTERKRLFALSRFALFFWIFYLFL